MSQPFGGPEQVTFLIGGLGAGKTELALNLSVWNASQLGPGQAHLLDLDIINPFFRVRRLRADLEAAGVVLVTPDARVQNGDVPALPARVWGTFEQPGFPIVCDVGGGELGLRPLARLTDLAGKRPVQVLCVINPYRPGFQTPEQMVAAMRRYSELSALTITHLVANPHLAAETTPDVFWSGLERLRAVAERVQVPLAFAMMSDTLAATFGDRLVMSTAGTARAGGFATLDGMPVFVIRRFWEDPWHLGRKEEDAPPLGPTGA